MAEVQRGREQKVGGPTGSTSNRLQTPLIPRGSRPRSSPQTPFIPPAIESQRAEVVQNPHPELPDLFIDTSYST
jgi:hypothetical protein